MKRLPGRQILIVEDTGLIAFELERNLLDNGCQVVGPAGTVAGALSLIGRRSVDGAVLDLNLAGEDASPVADALAKAGIPFMFLTGHSNEKIPARHRGRPLLQKPYAAPKLLSTLASILPEPGERKSA